MRRLALALALLVLGCSARTAIVLQVTLEPGLEAATDVVVVAHGPRSDGEPREYPASSEPRLVTLEPEDGAMQVIVDVQARVRGATVARRRVATLFTPGEARLLAIALRAPCAADPCLATACDPEPVLASSLPRWGGSALPSEDAGVCTGDAPITPQLRRPCPCAVGERCLSTFPPSTTQSCYLPCEDDAECALGIGRGSTCRQLAFADGMARVCTLPCDPFASEDGCPEGDACHIAVDDGAPWIWSCRGAGTGPRGSLCSPYSDEYQCASGLTCAYVDRKDSRCRRRCAGPRGTAVEACDGELCCPVAPIFDGAAPMHEGVEVGLCFSVTEGCP